MRIGPFGVWEILIILVVVLLVFGPRRLPEMAKGLGQSVRAFRKELRDMKSELDIEDKGAAPAPAATTRSSAAPAPAATTRSAAEPTPEPTGDRPTPPRESGDAPA